MHVREQIADNGNGCTGRQRHLQVLEVRPELLLPPMEADQARGLGCWPQLEHPSSMPSVHWAPSHLVLPPRRGWSMPLLSCRPLWCLTHMVCPSQPPAAAMLFVYQSCVHEQNPPGILCCLLEIDKGMPLTLSVPRRNSAAAPAVSSTSADARMLVKVQICLV